LWDRFAVVARSTTLQLRDRPFIRAAEAMGAGAARIILRDVLPNIAGSLMLIVALQFAHAVLLEATLAFLGFGTHAPLLSWGLMISEGSKDLMSAPWLVISPGVALFLLMFALNLIGSARRDGVGADPP
jgi:peptide/nickel transport system permease protein